MPQPVDETSLAASVGADHKRAVARQNVARAFLERHLFEAEPERERDWELVRRALQCIDFQRPVVIGPKPPPPLRLAPLSGSPLGPGFFAELPADGSGPAQPIDQDAAYMRYYTRSDAAEQTAGTQRFFIPRARAVAKATERSS